MAKAGQGLRKVLSGTRCESCLIIVPDIGSTAPETWSAPKESPWVRTLFKETVPTAHVFHFQYAEDVFLTFEWRKICQHAEEFLDELLKLRKDPIYTEVPIQMLCFGLGGLIVKEALQSTRAHPSYLLADLLTVLAGIAFFATPHSTSDDEFTWNTLYSVPRIQNKNAKKRKPEKNEMIAIAETCDRFAEMSLDLPVLSVFEEQETIVQSSLPRNIGNKRLMIVGKTRCGIGTASEEILPMASDYSRSCHISVSSTTFQGLQKFILSAISSAQMRILVEMSKPSIQLPSDRYTVRTQSLREDDSSARDDTGVGTTGSTTASYLVIPGTNEFEAAHRDPILPCYQMGNRIRNLSFLGRSDVLSRIGEQLLPSSQEPSSSGAKDLKAYTICGMGGIGKSEIATEFMFAHRADFEAIFWLQADQATTLRDGFSHIAVKLGLEETQAKDPDSSMNLVKGWLAQPIKKHSTGDGSESNLANWLIIFDNVDNPDDLNDFWPQFGKGSVLITSRDPLSKKNVYSGSTSVDLIPLSEDDGARLLTRLTDRALMNDSQPSEQARAVAHRLGGLPLGIVQMAGIINREDYTFQEFLKRYDEKNLADLHAQSAGWQHTDYTHTIASVWALETLKDDPAALLDILAVLNPDAIQEDILTERIDEASVILKHFPTIDIDYQQARKDLIRRSLITRNKETLELRVHRLTQEAARARMNAERRQQVFSTAVELICRLWSFPTMQQRHTIARWPTCERLLPHVNHLLGLYDSFVKDTTFAATEAFARLLADAAGYLLERGGGAEFSHLLDCAQAVCEAQRHDTRDLLSEIHYIRGAQATEMNNKSVALPSNVTYMKLRIELSKTSPKGTHDAKLAHAYNQAGNAYLDRGDVEKATELYLKSIETFRSIPGSTELDISIAVANLGSAYWVAGNLDRASETLLKNLKAREEKLGLDDTQSFRTGRLLFGLANVRASQGQWTEAYKLHQRALAQYRATLGDEHHRTADTYYKVAEHHVRFGQHASARTYLEKAIEVYSSKPYFRQELSRAKFLMGHIASVTGHASEAGKFKKEALELYRTVKTDVTRSDDEITRDDFDKIVTYASR